MTDVTDNRMAVTGSYGAVAAVQSLLSHPLMGRAPRAMSKERCRSEASITHTLADATLDEGVLNLVFLRVLSSSLFQ
jgi:hypothetical protein